MNIIVLELGINLIMRSSILLYYCKFYRIRKFQND